MVLDEGAQHAHPMRWHSSLFEKGILPWERGRPART